MSGQANEIGGHCRSFAWLEDWCGWTWCFKHWLRNIRHGGKRWFEFKSTKVFL